MRQDFPLLRLSCRIWTYDHVNRLLSETLTLPGTAYASAGTSSYDSNGALVSDTGRGISSITWNEINLPGTVTFSDGSSVAYCYAADGTKLRETRTVSGTATVIDWCGDLVLEKTGSGPRSAKRLMMDGGYVDLATGNTARRHFVRDHLGSVRAVVDDAGTVLETDDYYPLGGPLPTGTSAALQPQKYQGKDWNPTASFNVYDFGARLYDPALGRWLSQDPLAEKYQTHSPYLFCAGNPMRFVDDGGEDLILAGINSSSVIFETQLVDIRIDLSFIGIDWGGNFNFQGEQLLSTALDIAGIFDPSGTCDAINSRLQFESGHIFDSAMSLISIIPAVGDAAKITRIGKDIRTINDAISVASSGFKLTKSLRKNMIKELKATGKSVPIGMDAHHIFPKKFEREFCDLGININDPKYGVWSDLHIHWKNAKTYNNEWAEF